MFYIHSALEGGKSLCGLVGCYPILNRAFLAVSYRARGSNACFWDDDSITLEVPWGHWNIAVSWTVTTETPFERSLTVQSLKWFAVTLHFPLFSVPRGGLTVLLWIPPKLIEPLTFSFKAITTHCSSEVEDEAPNRHRALMSNHDKHQASLCLFKNYWDICENWEVCIFKEYDLTIWRTHALWNNHHVQVN